VRIHTQQGANLGGTGESQVEVSRRPRRRQNVFRIHLGRSDPLDASRPMIKREDGWHLLATRVDVADVADFYEDKLAIGFSLSPTFRLGPEHLPRHESRSPTSRLRSRLGIPYTSPET